MRILFLCEGTLVPASRFRVAQFLPYFEKAGIDCTVRYGYGDGYNSISQTRWSTAYRLGQRLKRAVAIADAGNFDVVFCQRLALPQSSLPEQLLAKLNRRIVFDYDDSIWLGAEGAASMWRKSAFDKIAGLATHLIAGNSFLKVQAGRPHKTTVIPTVIDTVRYSPAPTSGERVVIGWMGTSANFPFLERLVPSLLRVLARNPDVVLRVVANKIFVPLMGHKQVQQIAWSAKDEIELLRSFSIGLMPLVSSEMTRGKCAFKMITYMAVGAPVLVSDVGANRDVMGLQEAGFLKTGFDWDKELSELIQSRSERERLGRAGRERVVNLYSISAVLPRYLNIFERVARS